MQATVTFAVADYATFKIQLLSWSSRFNSCCFLDNHSYQSPWQQQECLLAAGCIASVTASAGNALIQLQQFVNKHPAEWIFGHLGFGLQAETESIPNRFATSSGFTDLHFFVPEWVVQCNHEQVVICGPDRHSIERVYQDILAESTSAKLQERGTVTYRPLLDKVSYLTTVQKLQEHIRRGDCYEINFCQEFVADEVVIDPVTTYLRLSDLSPNPFSCFYRKDHAYLACASPERYIMRRNSRILSQPIKGTASRDVADSGADNQLREQLRTSAKDQSENVMVVDLVRNDLAKVCQKGSVKVDELFGIYTYPQVHQMISTVSGELEPGISFTDILKATFPMGSMTGAPKKKVLELISQYEISARGLFSGSVGYISPDGNFDFNVVIRSIVYNAAINRLSFHVGSGITWYSNAEMEYEECLWKAAAIEKVLRG